MVDFSDAARSQLNREEQPVRADLVNRVRAEIASGKYDSDEKLDIVVDRLQRGEPVIIDFDGVRAPAQSFVHSLLAEAFSVAGSLVRLSFTNCTPSARAVLEMVAAYASYRRVVGD